MIKTVREIFNVIRAVPIYWLLILLQVVGGLLSFLGLPLLVPILEYLGEDQSNSTDPIIVSVNGVLASFGFTPSLSSLLVVLTSMFLIALAINVGVAFLAQCLQYSLWRRQTLRLLNEVLAVKWSWITKRHSGEINHALYGETAAWSETCFLALTLISGSIQALSYLSVAIYINVWVALSVLGMVVLILLANLLIIRGLRQISAEKNAHQQHFSELVQSTQQNRKFLKATFTIDGLRWKFSTVTQTMMSLAVRMAGRSQSVSFITQATGFLAFVVIIMFNDVFEISYSQLLVILFAFMQVLPHVHKIVAGLSDFNQKKPIFDAFESRLSDLRENQEIFGTAAFDASTSIEVRQVSFSYDSDQQVLKDISFEIKANATLAIVGRSGAGKSTFLDLLLGLIKPTDGAIMYGNIPHTDLDYRDLRSKVAYVGQDTTLFSGTLEENLCFVSGPVARDRLQLVCDMVGLGEFVAGVDHGFQTVIGENGIRLSGGQRQRVALARALLAEPKILVLDEATSSLDAQTEAGIWLSIRQLQGRLTIIIVTHKLSSIKFADEIIVVKERQIVERGSYDDLVSRDGDFKALSS